MTHTLEAIYENGVLRPVKPIAGLGEHSRVKITLEDTSFSHHLTDLIGTLSDSAAAEMSAAVDAEFEKVDLREWQ